MAGYDEIKMADNEVKDVYTLNQWTEDKLAEAAELLAEGYWVHFGSTALGFTAAHFTEWDGINWAEEKYGDNLEIAYRADYLGSMLYCRLKEV